MPGTVPPIFMAIALTIAWEYFALLLIRRTNHRDFVPLMSDPNPPLISVPLK